MDSKTTVPANSFLYTIFIKFIETYIIITVNKVDVQNELNMLDLNNDLKFYIYQHNTNH